MARTAISAPESIVMGKTVPLRRESNGNPIILSLPRRVQSMEVASGLLFEALGKLTVRELKLIQPTGPYVSLIDALIDVRRLMGGDGSEE